MTNEDISELKARIIKKRLSDLPYNDREVNQCVSDISWVIHELLSQGLLMVWNTDMDSAPRDGTYVLTSSDFGVCEAWWNGYAWITSVQSGSDEYAPLSCIPTAWMPFQKEGE